jgi:hypothetical protein
MNKILGALLFLLVLVIVLRFRARQAEQKASSSSSNRMIMPMKAAFATLLPVHAKSNQLGVGMARPKFFDNSKLCFYNNGCDSSYWTTNSLQKVLDRSNGNTTRHS